MLPWMDVPWFDIRNHPSGLVLHGPAQPDDGGNDWRVILTKPFDWSLYGGLDLRFEFREEHGIQTYEHGPDSRSFEGSTSK